ncbi:MAG: hypothetical protein ABJD07_05835 [Gemmatimonadaceae bacterium]
MSRTPCQAIARFCAAAALAGAALVLGACNDNGVKAPAQLTLTVANPATILRNDAIRVLVGRSDLNVQTALDPQNFVVTNLCNGLRIDGSVRVSGDTLIFTPTQVLPYLIRIGVRVQNLLATSGVGLAAPFTFSLLTEAPPVSDISWGVLNSPTDDALVGISFVSRTTGYMTSSGGGVYATGNTGITWEARFKTSTLSLFTQVRAFGDTVFTAGVFSNGTGTSRHILKSVDAAHNFTTPVTLGGRPFSLDGTRASNGHIRIATMTFGSVADAYVYDAATGALIIGSGLSANSEYVPTQIDISKDAASTILTYRSDGGGSTPVSGQLYVSRDSGRTYAAFNFGRTVFQIAGGGFVDNNTALALGDSSQVFRVNLAAGTYVLLGAAQGIPQGESDPVTGRRLITYTFRRSVFTTGGQIGWIVGTVRRSVQGQADQVSGIILISRDGGLTWKRQAINGAADNGLAFPSVIDLTVLAADFSALSGSSGLNAARQADTQTVSQACSLTQP